MKYRRLAVPHQSEPLDAAGLRLLPDRTEIPPQPQTACGTAHSVLRPLNHYLPEAPNHLHHKSRATIKRRTALMDKNLFIKYK